MLPNHEKRLLTKSQPALPGEEIVISGISGKFPNAENIQVFSDKLYSKVRIYRYIKIVFLFNGVRRNTLFLSVYLTTMQYKF